MKDDVRQMKMGHAAQRPLHPKAYRLIFKKKYPTRFEKDHSKVGYHGTGQTRDVIMWVVQKPTLQ